MTGTGTTPRRMPGTMRAGGWPSRAPVERILSARRVALPSDVVNLRVSAVTMPPMDGTRIPPHGGNSTMIDSPERSFTSARSEFPSSGSTETMRPVTTTVFPLGSFATRLSDAWLSFLFDPDTGLFSEDGLVTCSVDFTAGSSSMISLLIALRVFSSSGGLIGGSGCLTCISLVAGVGVAAGVTRGSWGVGSGVIAGATATGVGVGVGAGVCPNSGMASGWATLSDPDEPAAVSTLACATMNSFLSGLSDALFTNRANAAGTKKATNPAGMNNFNIV